MLSITALVSFIRLRFADIALRSWCYVFTSQSDSTYCSLADPASIIMVFHCGVLLVPNISGAGALRRWRQQFSCSDLHTEQLLRLVDVRSASALISFFIDFWGASLRATQGASPQLFHQ